MLYMDHIVNDDETANATSVALFRCDTRAGTSQNGLAGTDSIDELQRIRALLTSKTK